jgi:hypothetical protein
LADRDVDRNAMNYSPHLYVKTEQEIEEEERRRAARPPVTGSNSATIYVDERKGSAKRRESTWHICARKDADSNFEQSRPLNDGRLGN